MERTPSLALRIVFHAIGIVVTVAAGFVALSLLILVAWAAYGCSGQQPANWYDDIRVALIVIAAGLAAVPAIVGTIGRFVFGSNHAWPWWMIGAIVMTYGVYVTAGVESVGC